MFSNLLNKEQNKKILEMKNTICKSDIIALYNHNYKKNLHFVEKLIENNASGWEMTVHMPHPIIFELGHITLFYEHHILRHFREKEGTILENSYDMFDSMLNRPEERKYSHIINFKEQIKYYKQIHSELLNYLEYEPNVLTPFKSYVLMIGYLHNIMHREVYYLLSNMLRYPCFDIIQISKKQEIEYINTWIDVSGGEIDIGLKRNDRLVVWDNEMPKHKVTIHGFKCQEQPVMNHEYINFIENGGYTNKKYWSKKGYKWKEETLKKNHPYFWVYNEKKTSWFKYHFDKIIEIVNNEPVVNISYYEAEAYANYKNARLPSENEYMLLLTNKNKTKYPWGNDDNCDEYSNVNFKYNDVVSVNHYKGKGKNDIGIDNLFGNCWYWTTTSFYPYDNFKIDPVYDLFSYPFFYFRNIVKGCSWGSNDILVHSNYRNAQEKDAFFQLIGIRLVK